MPKTLKLILAAALFGATALAASAPAGAGWWRLCGNADHGWQCGS